jgi:hypothetical protein
MAGQPEVTCQAANGTTCGDSLYTTVSSNLNVQPEASNQDTVACARTGSEHVQHHR